MVSSLSEIRRDKKRNPDQPSGFAGHTTESVRLKNRCTTPLCRNVAMFFVPRPHRRLLPWGQGNLARRSPQRPRGRSASFRNYTFLVFNRQQKAKRACPSICGATVVECVCRIATNTVRACGRHDAYAFFGERERQPDFSLRRLLKATGRNPINGKRNSGLLIRNSRFAGWLLERTDRTSNSCGKPLVSAIQTRFLRWLLKGFGIVQHSQKTTRCESRKGQNRNVAACWARFS